ncbi:MAG: response regulator [Elusimicrobiota bacterium]
MPDTPEQPANTPKKKVLLVDDDEDLLEIYELKLLKAGFDAETANGGLAALRKMETFIPDVVVLDLMMPNCSGFDVLLKLQQRAAPRPPVIVISGVHKDADTVQRIRMEPIVFEFLFKPISPKALVDTVRRAVPTELP